MELGLRLVPRLKKVLDCDFGGGVRDGVVTILTVASEEDWSS